MMHKQILRATLAVAATGLAGAAAHAQSSVTLYGIVDAGITYTNNQKGQSAYQATPGNVQGSRWGLLGSEDLGGGNKVLFRLENSFNLETGALGGGGRMFGRGAWVGLSNDRAGTITLGRQYNSVQDYLSNMQINGVGALSQYANAVYDNDDLNNTYRTDNAVKYTTPTWAGFTANAMYAFSNTAGQFANNRAWSAGADYVNGPLHLDAAYSLVDQPASNTAGAAPSDNYYGTSSSIISNVARNQVWGAGGSYAFGPATLALLYTNSQFNLIAGGSLRFANYEASVRYQLTPATLLSLGYIYTSQNSSAASAANAHYNQVAVGGEYFLSKTTDLYLNGIYQNAAGSKAWIEGISNPSSTNGQFSTVAGIRHKF
ncbi:porin [Paraburkholderia phenazinium]|jgi:GBP family porin|uniref:Outer membrane protein (Porin) n=1 Tax=Paraburkholderia phenazinium TaxID=60549 RepID=A0A1N6KWH4_9BURK|nr:porin [Paraburkholderia phenazinium]SIO60869.1 Outer membrane protein (porin) [Paraburkholderia phenazinium]